MSSLPAIEVNEEMVPDNVMSSSMRSTGSTKEGPLSCSGAEQGKMKEDAVSETVPEQSLERKQEGLAKKESRRTGLRQHALPGNPRGCAEGPEAVGRRTGQLGRARSQATHEEDGLL